jgi:hypothetical protein
LQRRGRLHAAQTDVVVEKKENVIMTDGHVIVKQLSFHLDSWEASVCRILEHLGYMGSPAATGRKEDHQSVASKILARFMKGITFSLTL